MQANKHHYVQAYLELIQSYQKKNQICVNSDLMAFYREANCSVYYYFKTKKFLLKGRCQLLLESVNCCNIYKHLFVYCSISGPSKLKCTLVYLKYHDLIVSWSQDRI